VAWERFLQCIRNGFFKTEMKRGCWRLVGAGPQGLSLNPKTPNQPGDDLSLRFKPKP
jgi:hypothetical protein